MPALDQPQTVQQVPGVPAATAQEELGAAPAQDPALAQPLPPLATFDATPPAEIADEGSDGNAEQIRYAVTVKGLQAKHAAYQLGALSTLADGDRTEAHRTTVRGPRSDDVA